MSLGNYCVIELKKIKQLSAELTEKEMLALILISSVTDKTSFTDVARILGYQNSGNLVKLLDKLIERNILVKLDDYHYDFVARSGTFVKPRIQPRKTKTIQERNTDNALLPEIKHLVDNQNKHVWAAAMKNLREEHNASVSDVAKCVQYLHFILNEGKTKEFKVSSATLRREYKKWLDAGKPTERKTVEDLLNEI